MTNQQLRTQIAFGCAQASDFTDDRFYPSPVWGTYGAEDYPTVLKHNSGTSGTLTRTVQFWDGTTYNLPNENGCFSTNENNFYLARDFHSESFRYSVTHTRGKAANWLYGHQGVASANTVQYSFQRGVIGLSWQWTTGQSSISAGLVLKNVFLLYRKQSNSSRFFGAKLIQSRGYATGTKHQHFGNDPFDTGSYAAQKTGKISVNLGEANNNAIPAWVRDEALVFQGIWFETENFDTSATQSQVKYAMHNVRLIYRDESNFSSDRDYTERIVLPRNWSFGGAMDKTKPLRLT